MLRSLRFPEAGRSACLLRLLDEFMIKLGVFAAVAEELAVRAALDDSAGIDDEDLIGLHDGG